MSLSPREVDRNDAIMASRLCSSLSRDDLQSAYRAVERGGGGGGQGVSYPGPRDNGGAPQSSRMNFCHHLSRKQR